jgi:hypothetical protein
MTDPLLEVIVRELQIADVPELILEYIEHERIVGVHVFSNFDVQSKYVSWPGYIPQHVDFGSSPKKFSGFMVETLDGLFKGSMVIPRCKYKVWVNGKHLKLMEPNTIHPIETFTHILGGSLIEIRNHAHGDRHWWITTNGTIRIDCLPEISMAVKWLNPKKNPKNNK